MKTFDLFDTIEDASLVLQPQGVVNMKRIEEMTMQKINANRAVARKHRKSFGVYLLAAILITFLMATTVFAYVGFTQYDNPTDMMNTFFGNKEFSSQESKEIKVDYFDKHYTVTAPAVERVPLDEELAQEQAPPITAVGKSVSFNGNTLTIIAHQHDNVLGAGTIYYTVENPNGISGYKTQQNGEVLWPDGELVWLDRCVEKNYIITGETTDSKLSIACYYVGVEQQEGWQEQPYIEMLFRDTKDSVRLPCDIFEPVSSLSSKDAQVQLTSIGMELHLQNMEFLYFTDDGKTYPPVDNVDIDYLAVRFTDGTEFVVEQDNGAEPIDNSPYSCNFNDPEEGTIYSLLFNRIIDLEKVESVIINDVAFKVS